jgi:putative two-component system response regulator
MMPGRDGFDVCRAFKRDMNLRHTRVIMVSARAELASRLNGYAAGTDDYVTKPFDEEELLTKITFALKTKRLNTLCGATGEVLALVSELRDTIDLLMSSVRDFSAQLANELRQSVYADQVTQQFLDDLDYASALRDVGLLAVPERVLENEGHWTDAEFEQVKQHTLVGRSLLDRLSGEHPTVSLLRLAADVAQSHHERFDGSGYPHQTSGADIPLAARIVSVAEAMAELHSIDQLTPAAFAKLCEPSGRPLFDPVVVAAANQLLKTAPNAAERDTSSFESLTWTVDQLTDVL